MAIYRYIVASLVTGALNRSTEPVLTLKNLSWLCYPQPQNNKSVVVHWYPALWKKWLHPPTASGSYCWQAGEYMAKLWNFKILYKLNCLDLCNITTVLELHFSQLFSSKAVCFEVRKFSCHFSCQSLLLNTSTLQDDKTIN